MFGRKNRQPKPDSYPDTMEGRLSEGIYTRWYADYIAKMNSYSGITHINEHFVLSRYGDKTLVVAVQTGERIMAALCSQRNAALFLHPPSELKPIEVLERFPPREEFLQYHDKFDQGLSRALDENVKTVLEKLLRR